MHFQFSFTQFLQGAKKIHEIPSSRSEFHNTTADIAAGIHRTTSTLGDLTRLVRQQGLFDDPTEQINSLIVRIKTDISDLNSKCDSAQQFVENSKRQRGINAQSASHNSGVVTSLKSELMQATQGFKTALEMRSSKMKNQQERRVMLAGNGALSPMKQFKASANAGAAGGGPMAVTSPQPVLGAGVGGGQLKMSSPYSTAISYENHRSSSSSDHMGMSSHSAQLQQQQQQQLLLVQPPSQHHYYEQRQEAVSEVERSIGKAFFIFDSNIEAAV